MPDLPSPGATPPGWYDDPACLGSLRYWDGTGWADPDAPGWKHVDQGFLWWDGQQHTAQARWDGSKWAMYDWDGTAATAPIMYDARTKQLPPIPPRSWRPPRASGKASISMAGLVIAGCATLAWWGAVPEERPCGSNPQVTYTVYDGIWLPWLVLVGLAALGVAVWQNLAWRSRLITTMAILGVIAAAVTFPVLSACEGALDCPRYGSVAVQ